MSNESIIRSWKNKKYAISRDAGSVPANPAGSSGVSLKDIEAGEFITSPASQCSFPPHCLCDPIG
jgi:hypothetical protein